MINQTDGKAETFEELLNRWDDPAVLASQQVTEALLESKIFAGLNDLKPAFDSAKIKHFNFADFGIVIERCTLQNVLVIGIEVFTSEGEGLDVQIAPECSYTNAWCFELLEHFEHQTGLSYCATYLIDPESSKPW